MRSYITIFGGKMTVFTFVIIVAVGLTVLTWAGVFIKKRFTGEAEPDMDIPGNLGFISLVCGILCAPLGMMNGGWSGGVPPTFWQKVAQPETTLGIMIAYGISTLLSMLLVGFVFDRIENQKSK